MSDYSNVTEAELQAEVSAWLDQHFDPSLSLIEWRSILVDSGWGVPAWPGRWHGKDLPQKLVPVVSQEFRKRNVVTVATTGTRNLAAMTLLEHGNDDQKERFLHRILTGEDTWCQLFSEPGSGSDLAGSTTRADLDGDRYRVSGQKVWTTSAHHADYGLLLARTDWDLPKHQGLTYFVMEMKQPGVSVQQLRQMNGHASFNEVFFDDAIARKENIVSRLGDGWQVAMTTLAHERGGPAGTGGGRGAGERERERVGRVYDEERAEEATTLGPYKWYPQRAGRVDLVLPRARESGKIDDPAIRQEIAKLLILARSSEWTTRRAAAAQRRGRRRGPEGSLGKLAGVRVARQAARVHTLISGADAMLTGKESPMEGLVAEILLSVPATSIAGGTDEIQKNIVAERVLGMEKEPRADTGPFRDVPRNVTT